MNTRNGGKIIFWEKKGPNSYAYSLHAKNFAKIALSRTVSQINMFLEFMQKNKMDTENGRKQILLKLQILHNYIYSASKNFLKIALPRTISHKMHVFRNSRCPPKWQKKNPNFWQKVPNYSPCILWAKDFTKLFYLALFLRYQIFFIFTIINNNFNIY